MDPLKLDPRTTALVLIDLQKGIVGRQTAPHAAAQVVERGARLASRCREVGAAVVLVHVAYAADGKDRLAQKVDAAPLVGATGPEWSEIVPELGPKLGDLVVLKRQWGAFYGTDLDLLLRRRVSAPSSWAGSRPTSASSPPRATDGNAVTSWCSWRTRWPGSRPRPTGSR